MGNLLVIFDCDGVLIDSEIVASKVGAAFANSFGHPITPQEVSSRFAGKPSRVVWETICEELGIEFKLEDYQEMQRQTHAAYAKELKAIDGVETLLKSLGNKFCVASTTRLEQLKKNLDSVGLKQYFGENIFSASQVERPKPFPDVFLFAAKNMGFSPDECIVIEDSPTGVKAGINAQMQVFGFTGAGHIVDGHAETLLNAGATATFSKMADFYEVISRYNPNLIRK